MVPTTAELKVVAEQCGFLQGLTEAEQLAVLNAGILRHFPPKSFILYQDDPATTFYLIVQGRVKLTQITPEGHQIILAYLGPGDGLGIIVALSDMSYPVSAEVVEATTLLAYDRDTTRRLLTRYPPLALNGMDLIARQFKRLSDRYRELATERVERRVARALLRLVRQAGKREDAGILIDMPLSRQDLAQMTGTTLYTVSRILSAWENAGLIQSGRERVVIIHPHDLMIIAEDLPQTPRNA